MLIVVVPLGNVNVWFAGNVKVAVRSVVIVTLMSVARLGVSHPATGDRERPTIE